MGMKKKAKEEKKENKRREKEERKMKGRGQIPANQVPRGGPCAAAQNSACPAPCAAPQLAACPAAALPLAETHQVFNESIAMSEHTQSVQAIAEQALYSVPPQQNASAPASRPTDDDAMLCVVCLEQRKNVMVEPCAHLCLCSSCANADAGTKTQYKICRATIQGFRVIYM